MGEPIDKIGELTGQGAIDAFYGPFVPIDYREVPSDTIRLALANLKHGFAPPRAKIMGVDLRDVDNARGQSAHDRWSQLHGEVRVHGKTLRQELSGLMRSAKYKALSPNPSISGPSPRVQQVRQVVSRYRDTAMSKMLSEYPELAREIQRREQDNSERKRGLRALQGGGGFLGVETNIGSLPRP